MGIANNTISGAYKVSETSTVQTFLNTYKNSLSGAAIFIIPDASNQKFHIGISHGALG